MQLPDETIAYDFQRLLAPPPRGVDAARGAAGAALPHAGPARTRSSSDATAGPQPGRRRARTARTSPAEDPAARRRLHRPAAEDARPASAASRTPANSARSSASRTGSRKKCDRVVVLGIGGSYLGAQALFDALCHTYHNELPAKLRMGTPRIYFEGQQRRQRRLAGTARAAGEHLRRSGRSPRNAGASIVISKSGGTLETAAAYRAVPAEVAKFYGSESDVLTQLIVPDHRADGQAPRPVPRPTATPTTTS